MRFGFLAIALLLASALFPFLTGTAMGQAMPGMNEVSGRYVNEEFGVEIMFPDGWTGFEFTTEGTLSVMTSEDDILSGGATRFISFGVVDKDQVADIPDPTSQPQDGDQQVDCSEPAIGTIQVSGRTGYQTVTECTQDDGQVYKYKAVSVETQTHWVTVVYASPIEAFAEDEANFDSAVESLVVEGAIDAEGIENGTTPEVGLITVAQSLVVAGEAIDLDVRTSSSIDNFELDEESKAVSFTVDGPDGTQGTTEIEIGKVLEGPYTVSIDGEVTSDFEVTNEGTSEAMISISYTHSVHDITITGTNVVPEFPMVVIAAIAAVIGAVAMMGRLRLIPGVS